MPAWAVPCMAVFTPLLLVAGARLAGRVSRAEAHHAILLAVYCVATTGTLTNWVKANVSARKCRGAVAAGARRSGCPPLALVPASQPPFWPFRCPFLNNILVYFLQIGRPRPHFLQRCWPNGLKPVFSPDGLPRCADSAIDPLEGIKVGWGSSC